MSRFVRMVWSALIRYPVSSGCIAVAVFLCAAVNLDQLVTSADSQTVQERWGGVSVEALVSDPELNGPFDLWRGEWWRVFVSAFHHAGLIHENWLQILLSPMHIMLNVLSLWFLGKLLEPRMGTLRYLLFLLTGCSVASLAEFLLGNQAIGLSGFVYAQFGALLVIRRSDEEIAWYLSKEVVLFGVGWMFGCVLLTELDILPIANVAHFVGFGYGLAAGTMMTGWAKSRPLLRAGFVASHLALVPGFYYVTHPEWNGMYHWYLASQERDAAKAFAQLKQAVALDPGLRGPKMRLADTYLAKQDWKDSWTMILEVLRLNPVDRQARWRLQGIWIRLTLPDDRKWAMQAVADAFRNNAGAGNSRTGIPREIQALLGPVVILRRTDQSAEGPKTIAPHEPQGLPGTTFGPMPHTGQSAPGKDPRAPESAVEGVTL